VRLLDHVYGLEMGPKRMRGIDDAPVTQRIGQQQMTELIHHDRHRMRQQRQHRHAQRDYADRQKNCALPGFQRKTEAEPLGPPSAPPGDESGQKDRDFEQIEILPEGLPHAGAGHQQNFENAHARAYLH
jgi:hypothetical protein